MNNIFMYSPKELATDAFLKWCVIELSGNYSNKKILSQFFFNMGLCNSPNDDISDVEEPTMQEEHTDLILRYKVNGDETKALFENKTNSTIHSDQLKLYRDKFPNFDYYKYMKLGYINFAERKYANELGYEVIDAYKLRGALEDSLKGAIVDQYKEFLDTQFIGKQNEIKNELIKHNKFRLFKESEAQQYLLSMLHEVLNERIPDHLEFKYSASIGGAPWTQLDIAKRKNAYGDNSEYVFWRIDKRGKGYYLRLNQYSDIDSDNYLDQKRTNLQILRDSVNTLFNIYAKDKIALAQVSDRGKKESEIVIMFFEDNQLPVIMGLLPQLSEEIYKFYSSFDQWA